MGVELTHEPVTGQDAPVAHKLPEDIAPAAPRLDVPEVDEGRVEALAQQLGLHRLAAELLVRRGVESIEAARAHVEPGVIHPPELLPGAAAAAELVAGHVGRGSRIAVHGDYDVDGTCSTAILVRALAGLDADVTWHVPSRFEDGYGLSRASVARLARDGVDLIIAVDCGISSIAEVAAARAEGIDVVICDHHTIGPELPDAQIVHPALADYPDPQLCASAAAHKLATLIVREASGDEASVAEDAALVALATVCDVVPLTGENRALVQHGLELLRRCQLPGLRELMRVAGVDQLSLRADSLGFALGPRINAAGRMGSAEPAVELLLTQNSERAAELAAQLAGANRLRKEIEQEVLGQAESQAARQRDRYALVVAGEGWHPGVLGIVAGRLAERYRRPALVLGLDAETASGSGRAGGPFDLHGGLDACAELLTRFGGHRAAAGLELPRDRLDALRERFSAVAAESLTPDDLRPQLPVDVVVAPSDVNLEVVDALERLGPFGAANPTPQVLLSGVRLDSVAKLGRTGNHFKLGVSAQGVRANVVAFRQDRVIAQSPLPRPVDLVVELQRNEYNGREEAQAVMRALIERDDATAARWRSDFERALTAEPEPPGKDVAGVLRRQHTVVAYRHVRDGDGQLETLLGALAADLPSAAVAGLALRSLSEIGVVGFERSDHSVDGFHIREGGGALDQSPTFRAYSGSQE